MRLQVMSMFLRSSVICLHCTTNPKDSVTPLPNAVSGDTTACKNGQQEERGCSTSAIGTMSSLSVQSVVNEQREYVINLFVT